MAAPSSSSMLLRPKLSTPIIAPKLLHLIDSAITGVEESVRRLRHMVSTGANVDDVSMSVVDGLLITMGGIDGFGNLRKGEETGSSPSIMHNSRAAVVAAELIPWLPWQGDLDRPMSPRTRLVNGLLYALCACTRNRAMCSASGLLGVLLDCVEKISVEKTDGNGWDGSPLCQCIQVLAGHSVTVPDLHRWLGVVVKTIRTDWALHLMLALEKAMEGMEARGPACTFEFDGESSGLLCPGESRWPFLNGYGFATWVYIESFADALNMATAAAAIAAAAAARSGKSSPVSAAAAASALAGEGTMLMPRLFSFLSPEGHGLEVYFNGHFLVVEYESGKGRKASLHFTYPFQQKCWYFIGLEHTCKLDLIGKAEGELRLYVDGNLHESRPFEFPRISKPLAFCCIGTNPPPTMDGIQRRRPQCPLFAEMGPVYIFKGPIGPEKMAKLAARGGDVLPSFGNGAGIPCGGVNAQMRRMAEESFALDAEIEGNLYLLYHPKLLSGRFCPSASAGSAAGTHPRSAEVFGQVHVASRIRATESLWALAYGGPMALLPLTVSNVHKDSLDPVIGDFSLSLATASLSAPIFRIITKAIDHIGNNDELYRIEGPEVLSKILHYLLKLWSVLDLRKKTGLSDEELVATVISLCLSQKENHALKVKLFTFLLLDLKVWSLCNYGVQKNLLSSLADMVFTESLVMRDANAVQMLLDGCRRCYWVVREEGSVDLFSLQDTARHVGEVNALVDELLVVIELMIGAASPSLAVEDLHRLIGFLVDCPQSNQVARVLHLICRLVVQPNASKAPMFAESFISSGGVEMLLVLLQKEAKLGDQSALEQSNLKISEYEQDAKVEYSSDSILQTGHLQSQDHDSHEESSLKAFHVDNNSSRVSLVKMERKQFSTEDQLIKNLGGINLSSCAKSAKNNVCNIDKGDGIVIGIINLLGALVTLGYLKLGSLVSASNLANSFLGGNLTDDSSIIMLSDKISLLLFALQKAFQAAPCRLMTTNVYMSLMGATMNLSSVDDGLNIYDSGHRFEHLQLLLVLLRSLPYASRAFQMHAIQDMLFLACSHPENRSKLTGMEEWPEWILEVLISNYEMGSNRASDPRIDDIEDLIHNFLLIFLEHSMRRKDGWKDVEATIHCAEWLSMVGGSSTGDLRARREESLPIFKRRLLGDLVDFAARELQVQTQVIAAVAAGVAAEGLSPQEAKIEVDNAAHLSMALAENAIVILMLVEDHLRLQSQLHLSTNQRDTTESPSFIPASFSHLYSIGGRAGASEMSRRPSALSDSGGLPLDVLASMADANGQISAAVMERLTAAAAAEPYESVRCAFVSYGSCAADLAEGWKSRTRMWYGVGLPSKDNMFGGGGSGWDSWKSVLEKDSNGNWIELPLVKKSVGVLQALLVDTSGLAGGLGIGGGSATKMGGMTELYQLLDSDQPFLCMLRLVLVSLREVDCGGDDILKSVSIKEGNSGLLWQGGSIAPFETHARVPTRKPRSALLWSVLAPILNMPISESKRQRALVASCVLYSEVWHAIGQDRKPLRKQYLEMVLPPFVAILRRWRPLLAGIHELTSFDGQNPLAVDDRALAADSLPLEAALSMISPGWAAAFASPPAAMALAMIAAGTTGGDTAPPQRNTSFRQDGPWHENRNAKGVLSGPKEKATSKAATLAASHDLERFAKIGAGRGLSAVAMATAGQRRSASDMERAKRWNISEAMRAAWTECLQSIDKKIASVNDLSTLSYKYVAVFAASFTLARDMQRVEISRLAQVDRIGRNHARVGGHTWRRIVHYLMDMGGLFAPFADQLNTKHVFWKLGSMESSSRMRMCFKKNYNGFIHLDEAANPEDVCLKPKSEDKAVCVINGSDESFSSFLSSIASILAEEGISLEWNKDGETSETDIDDKEKLQHLLSSSDCQSIQGQDNRSSSDYYADPFLLQSAAVVSPGYAPSKSDEKIILELPSSIVHPLTIVRGTFQVTSQRINFLVDEHCGEGFVDSKSPHRNHDLKKDRSWLISSLHRIFSRRYLLRRTALEFFMVDRSNFLFDFGTSEGRKNAYHAIVQIRPPHLNNICLATQKPDQLFKRTQLMERWSRWEISNFEYLMELNTLAGRSYNDITQYPVFPWILADYTSTKLDLEDPSAYRDLSKPIGALNVDRLQKFKEWHANFEDTVIPKFLYGSHYSSAESVLYYLVRVEPYTTLSIQLQSGQFNSADRIFSDIGVTWNGVLEEMNNVKELVPELFYLPEVLTNKNTIDFTAQHGEQFDAVKLPPWANSPVDFIHKHRMALESEHVSSHLHEWIDLIFGYKQRGKEAIAANNVFFHTTYEGIIDIDKIPDPVRRRTTQDQIAYFGQTPSQLLGTPHIRKQCLADILHLQTIFRNPNEIRPYSFPGPDHCNVPAVAMLATQDAIIIVDIGAPAANVALHKWQPNTPDGQGTPFLFQHGKTAANSTGGAFIRMFKGAAGSGNEEWKFSRAVASPALGIRSSEIVAFTSDRKIITGGHADNTVKLITADGAKTIESAAGHFAPVTCLAASSDSIYFVTGSRDTTVILWRFHCIPHLHNNAVPDALTYPATPSSPSGSRNIGSNLLDYRRRHFEGPIQILRGHRGEIVCCCVSSELGVVASSSYASGVLLHSMRRGRLIRKMGIRYVDAVRISSQGVVLIWSKSKQKLCTFTLNGVPIAMALALPFTGSINSVEISADGQNVLIGTSSSVSDIQKDKQLLNDDVGFENKNEEEKDLFTTTANMLNLPVPSICFLHLDDLKLFHTIKFEDGQDVTAVALTKDNTNLLVSTSDKQIIVITDPALSLKKVGSDVQVK